MSYRRKSNQNHGYSAHSYWQSDIYTYRLHNPRTQLTGYGGYKVWEPALVEGTFTEEAAVLVFIKKQLEALLHVDDGEVKVVILVSHCSPDVLFSIGLLESNIKIYTP